MLSSSSAAVMELKQAVEPWEEEVAVELDRELGEDGLRVKPLAQAAGWTEVESGLVMAGACLECVGVVQITDW